MNVSYVQLPTFSDHRGSMTYLDCDRTWPIQIDEVCWMSPQIPQTFSIKENSRIFMIGLNGDVWIKTLSKGNSWLWDLNLPSRALEIRHDCICSVGCNTSAIFLLLIKETLVKVDVTEPDRIQFVKRRESDSGRFTFEYVPLIIRRIYFLYDLTEGTRRGGHAHRQLSGLILAVRGRFDILLDDGTHQRQLTLTDTGDALFVPRMVWRELSNFSSDAVVLVLASGVYDEQEMIRNYNTFLTAKQNG